MKRIIDGKRYDTETAEQIAEWDNGHYGSDFRSCEEALYRTKKGQYFTAGSGGPLSKYAQSCGNGTSGGEGLILLDEQEAREWCENHNCVEALEKHFVIVEG